MALSFLTLPQQMVFVDSSMHLADANSLLPNQDYTVSFVVQNDSATAENAEITITHSAFGIGLPGGTSLITPNPVFVSVPPMAFGIKGQATATFTFHTPAGGHGCIVAKIDPNGPALNQNSSVISVPQGLPSNLSFLVFGFASADVLLTLTESEVTATNVPVVPFTLWHPVMVPPAGISSQVISPTRIKLTGLAHSSFYSVELQFTAPAFVNTHIFTVVGTNTATGEYLGEVQLRLQPATAGIPSEPSRPFILGGYQSQDILLTDPLTGANVLLGGAPGGAWDTLLRPNTNYGFSARVHNDSATPAVNTIVRFWKFPGGVGSNGVLVDVQSVTVPANGAVIVHSAHPFLSAAAGQHSCAAVSIYNAAAGRCAADAVNAIDVPDPGLDQSTSCSAWRNTDSQWVWAGLQWHADFDLGIPHPIWQKLPVDVTVETQYVPIDFTRGTVFREMDGLIKTNGLQVNKPLFLLPKLRETLKPIDLGLKITRQDGGKLAAGERKGSYSLVQTKDATTGFRVEGVIPKSVQKGEVMLVKVIAHYPKTDRTAGKNVEFLQVLHVAGERKI